MPVRGCDSTCALLRPKYRESASTPSWRQTSARGAQLSACHRNGTVCFAVNAERLIVRGSSALADDAVRTETPAWPAAQCQDDGTITPTRYRYRGA